MSTWMRALYGGLDRYAGTLFLIGLVGVIWRNWHLWQQDKARLAEQAEPNPLPSLDAWPAHPTVSVLVAAWNEAEHIEQHIESFLDLRYPNKELVLCAGGEDTTYELATRYVSSNVTVLKQQPSEGKQQALAHSFDDTRGEVIFLTDADCELTDEPFERTLWPIIADGEQAVTGSSLPRTAQINDPFAFTQTATQLYSVMHSPPYAPGILGRNCAVQRTLLADTAAFDTPAPSGTDYVLAKVLDAAGARIRQVPESRMPTDYPSTVYEYLRQQRRWLRNVALHGRRFGATDEMRASLRTSLIGVTMLLLPLCGFLFAPGLLLIWCALVAQALCARLRYLYFAAMVLNRPVLLRDIVSQGPLLLVDFAAWTQPLADYVRQRNRWVW